jgi:hypothetical protein
LDLDRDGRLRYFKDIVVRHPKMEQAVDDVMTLSAPSTGTDILLLIGPTGVGKSASTETVRRKYIELYEEELRKDQGFIPFAMVVAPASGEKKFSWRRLYMRLGEAVNEPLISRKMPGRAERRAHSVDDVMRRSGTVAGQQEAFENALKNRRTRLVVIDEAAHILANCGEATLVDHMNALKSIANVPGVTLMLVGSYDLYRLPMLSGQLARRTAVIHLARYVSGDREDQECFRRALRTLQNRLPLEPVPDLERYSKHLQVACVGCVGTLKDTLMRALALTLEKGGKWKDEYLRKSLLPEGHVAAILEETLKGERLLERTEYGRRSAEWPESA